jgi:hypothetical protein
MHLSKKTFATLGLVAALGLAVGAATQFKSVYKAPGVEATNFAGKKVAVLVMTDDMALRMSAEEALVRVLTERQVKAVASYTAIPREEMRNKDQAKSWFEQTGVQGIVVLRPVRMEHRVTEYAPGWTSSYYNTFWGYYGYGVTAAYNPGYTTRESIVVVETVVYDMVRDTLLWGGVSEVTDPKGMDAYMKQLVGDAVKEMQKAGLIKK